MLERLCYREINLGEVTGYAVAHPGYTERDGSPNWYAGGRLAGGRADLAAAAPTLEPGPHHHRSAADRSGSLHRSERRSTFNGLAGDCVCRANPALRGDGPDRGRRYGLGGGRNLPRHGPSNRKPSVARCGRRLRPRGPDCLRKIRKRTVAPQSSGSVRLSLTRGTVTSIAPALVRISRLWWKPLRTTRRCRSHPAPRRTGRYTHPPGPAQTDGRYQD